MTGASGRVAIVTGASRGIGRACAGRLAADGFDLVVGYATQVAAAEATAGSARASGVSAMPVQVEVADPGSVEALFTSAEEAYGGVDVVVHAAAHMLLSPLAEQSMQDIDDMLAVNLRGTLLVSRQAVRRLRGGGSLINFSSSVIGRPLPGYTVYSATKGAIEAMTFTLAHELRGRDVTVNSVAPGPTATDMFLDGKTAEQIEMYAKAAPLGRLGTPEEIAEVVAFLAGPRGHWINGQTLRANGGMH